MSDVEILLKGRIRRIPERPRIFTYIKTNNIYIYMYINLILIYYQLMQGLYRSYITRITLSTPDWWTPIASLALGPEYFGGKKRLEGGRSSPKLTRPHARLYPYAARDPSPKTFPPLPHSTLPSTSSTFYIFTSNHRKITVINSDLFCSVPIPISIPLTKKSF